MKNKTIISYKKQSNENYSVEVKYEGDTQTYVSAITKEQLLNQLALQGEEFKG